VRLPLPGGDAVYLEAFFGRAEGDRLFADLLERTPWETGTLTLFGKTLEMPRRIAWHGDPGASYAYSGLRHAPAPWTPALREIKRRVEREAGTTFNGVLLNLYRTGRDSMSWHADDEPELGPEPVIASVSLGAARVFQLKHRTDRGLERVSLELGHGSLLIMRGATQRHWLHQVPKTRAPVGPRINLTFRRIL
jgi:alkylated DNA repair dioxygenase AlkB